MPFPHPKPGDLIEASWFQAIYDRLDRGIQVVPPLFVTNGAIGLDHSPGFWVQFTGPPTDNKHPWKAITATPGGGWADGVGNRIDDQ